MLQFKLSEELIRGQLGLDGNTLLGMTSDELAEYCKEVQIKLTPAMLNRLKNTLAPLKGMAAQLKQ